MNLQNVQKLSVTVRCVSLIPYTRSTSSRIQISRRNFFQACRLNTKPLRKPLVAHTIDLQRAVIVERERLARHEFQQRRLQPGQTIVQTDNAGAQTQLLRHAGHEFMQGVHLRAAEVVTLAEGLVIVERLDK